MNNLKEYGLSEVISTITGKPVDQEKLSDTTISLKELGLSSLYVYRFISAIEEKFQVEFKDEDLQADNFHSIDSVLKLLEKYNN